MTAEAKQDPSTRLVDTLVVKIRRRQIVGSRNVALATAVLVQNVVRSVKFTTIDELLALIRAIGQRLVEANPKELASGNTIRRIIRLIREEYRAAAAAHLSQPPSVPGTPRVGPETPAFANAQSYFAFSQSPTASASASVNASPRPGASATLASAPPTPSRGGSTSASLSNFVAMRHSRAQGGERAAGSGDWGNFSASTSSLFATPPRASFDAGAGGKGGAGGAASASGSKSPAKAGVPARTASPLGGGLALGPGAHFEPAALARERDEFARQAGKLKPVLIQAIDEVVNELETTHEDVARGAKEHIHGSEVILTMGHSGTVEAFLRAAFRDRKFTAIVLESAPSFQGHAMAAALAAAKIPTLVVPDASLHAVMPRVTKVILGAHSVSANGGMFAIAGSLACCLAAKTHAKPVVVTTGQFKFAPTWNLYHEFDALDFQGPGPVIGYDHTGGGGGFEGVEVVDPMYDYIRPELINLYATNVGDHPPSYIYRLVKESYDDEDIEL